MKLLRAIYDFFHWHPVWTLRSNWYEDQDGKEEIAGRSLYIIYYNRFFGYKLKTAGYYPEYHIDYSNAVKLLQTYKDKEWIIEECAKKVIPSERLN